MRAAAIVPAALVLTRVTGPLPAQAPLLAAVEIISEIAVPRRVRGLARAVTLLVAAGLVAALLDQQAIEEAIVWAVVASAVEDAGAEAGAAVEEAGDSRAVIEEIHHNKCEPLTMMTAHCRDRQRRISLTVDA